LLPILKRQQWRRWMLVWIWRWSAIRLSRNCRNW
jgi:Beta-glucosidase-related glycosidases